MADILPDPGSEFGKRVRARLRDERVWMASSLIRIERASHSDNRTRIS